MQRKLFTLAAAVSLALCMATAALCVRGLWVNDIVARCTPSGSWDIQYWHGYFMLHISNDPGDSPPARTSWWPRQVTSADSDSPAFQGRWNRAGFVYLTETYPTRLFDHAWPFSRTPRPAIQHHLYLRAPLWFVALLSVVLPVIWARRWTGLRQRYRVKHNLCLICGYDLRASKDRCPECGVVRK